MAELTSASSVALRASNHAGPASASVGSLRLSFSSKSTTQHSLPRSSWRHGDTMPAGSVESAAAHSSMRPHAVTQPLELQDAKQVPGPHTASRAAIPMVRAHSTGSITRMQRFRTSVRQLFARRVPGEVSRRAAAPVHRWGDSGLHDEARAKSDHPRRTMRTGMSAEDVKKYHRAMTWLAMPTSTVREATGVDGPPAPRTTKSGGRRSVRAWMDAMEDVVATMNASTRAGTGDGGVARYVMWSAERERDFDASPASSCGHLAVLTAFIVASLAAVLTIFAIPFGNVDDGPWSRGNIQQMVALGYSGLLVYQLPVALICTLNHLPPDPRWVAKAVFPASVLFFVVVFTLSHWCVANGLCLLWPLHVVLTSRYHRVYPVPYVPVTCGFPGFVTAVVVAYKLIPRHLRAFAKTQRETIAAVTVALLTLVVLAAWAAHRSAFAALREWPLWQSLFTVLLPAMKFFFRCAVPHRCTWSGKACLTSRPLHSWVFTRVSYVSDPDVGPCMLFIVEYFNAIFVTTLLQDTSFMAGVLLLSYDVLGNGYATCAGVWQTEPGTYTCVAQVPRIPTVARDVRPTATCSRPRQVRKREKRRLA